jgi:SAM-dependent methyltransferase
VAVSLAARGFNVTALDFAEAAIARARRRAEGQPGQIRFEVCDVTQAYPYGSPFAGLLDRGCFYGLDSRDAAGYGRNMARICKPGARMVMLAPVWRLAIQTDAKLSAPELLTKIERTLAPAFKVFRVNETLLPHRPVKGRDVEVPGLAVYLERLPD